MTRYVIHNHLPAKDAGEVKIVYNKLLGGWYVVRGPHQTPLSGRFSSKEEAQASLEKRNKPERDFRGVVNRDEEERAREASYRKTGITRV